MHQIQFTETEMVKTEDNEIKRYPNLNTVLMVENFLEDHRDTPMELSDIKKQLPRQVMHQTLKIILEYLWRSGKIIYGPRGVQWIFSDPEHLKEMMKNTLEV